MSIIITAAVSYYILLYQLNEATNIVKSDIIKYRKLTLEQTGKSRSNILRSQFQSYVNDLEIYTDFIMKISAGIIPQHDTINTQRFWLESYDETTKHIEEALKKLK